MPRGAVALDEHEQREQGAVELDAGFPDQEVVPVGAVDHGDDRQHGVVQVPQPRSDMFIMHGP